MARIESALGYEKMFEEIYQDSLDCLYEGEHYRALVKGPAKLFWWQMIWEKVRLSNRARRLFR